MTLYLLRHAKSSWTDPLLRDHDRPLAPRGERAAVLMGTYLAGRQPAPSLVLCSTAVRARETLKRVLAQLPEPPEVRIEGEIYGTGPSGLLALIASVEPAVRSLLVVGHNPTIGALAVHLAGAGRPADRERMARKFPTAALAELRFEASRWDEIAPGDGELIAYSTPKSLESASPEP